MRSRLKYFSCAAIFVVLASASEASADFGGEACKEVPEPSSIMEMVQKSEFVALYRVRDLINSSDEENLETLDDIPLLEQLTAPKPDPVVQYRLYVVHELLGHGPAELVIDGLRPVVTIPDKFFFMEKRHEALVRTNNLWKGSSAHGMDANGKCRYTQDFILGYYYLIFGSVTSPAATEPILDRSYDPFYLEVERIIRHMSK